MTSFSVGDALDDGLGRLADRRLLPAVLAVYVCQLGAVVGSQSQLAAQREFVEENPDAVGSAFVPEELPLAVDLPLGVATLAWLVAVIGLIAATMFTVRTLAAVGSTKRNPGAEIRSSEAAATAAPIDADGTHSRTVDAPSAGAADTPARDGTPEPIGATAEAATTDGLAIATVRGIGAALVCGTAVGFGLLLFVLPGLFLASALAVVYPVVAVERESVAGAMRRSWGLTAGHRLRVFGLLVAVGGALLLVDLGGGLTAIVLSPIGIVGNLLNVAFAALGWVVALAVLVSGYEQLTAIETAREAKWEGVDDELLP